MTGYTFLCFALAIIFNACLTVGQLPARLSIPGAVLVSRPPQQRLTQSLTDSSQLPPTRFRKPASSVFPAVIPIREETEDSNAGLALLDDDSLKPNLPVAIPPRVENDEEDEPAPRPIFRPERPLPLLRQNVPTPPPRVALRQQSFDDEPQIVRQPLPQTRRVAAPQSTRQTAKVQPRPPQPEYSNTATDTRRNKYRKPPVQILRKYRTDNEDGSITWGFENEDGTFKEETIGIDCIIRGKYGYIDPEGTKREYSYETGNKCDQPEEELPPEQTPLQQNIPNRPPVYVKKSPVRV